MQRDAVVAHSFKSTNLLVYLPATSKVGTDKGGASSWAVGPAEVGNSRGSAGVDIKVSCLAHMGTSRDGYWPRERGHLEVRNLGEHVGGD